MEPMKRRLPYGAADYLGFAAILYGAFAIIFAVAVNLEGFLGIQTVFALLGLGQIPAGIGVLKRYGWARKLSQALAGGTVLLMLFWYLVTTLGIGDFADTGRGWASLSTLWLIAINFGLQIKSVRGSFGTTSAIDESSQQEAPPSPPESVVKSTLVEEAQVAAPTASGKTWYVRWGEQVRGPFRSWEVRQLAATGQIGPRTPLSVCAAGERPANWFAAGEVKGLRFLPDETLVAPGAIEAQGRRPQINLDQAPLLQGKKPAKPTSVKQGTHPLGYAIAFIVFTFAAGYFGIDLPWRPGAANRNNPMQNSQGLDKSKLPFVLGRGLSTEDIVKQTEQSVVRIEGKLGSASGFYVSHARIVTCAHAVDGEFIENIAIVQPTSMFAGRTTNLELVYIDYDRDLAILETTVHKRPLQLVAGGPFRRGEDLVIIGSPALGETAVLNNAVTRGLLSSVLTHEGRTYYQLDAAVNPGNSGGPAINSQGGVVGLVVASATQEQSLAFCVPASDIQLALQQVSQTNERQRSLINAMHRARACYALMGVVQMGLNECIAGESDFMSTQAQAFARYARRESTPTDPLAALPQTITATEVHAQLTRVSEDLQLDQPLRNDLVAYWNSQLEMRNLYLAGPSAQNWFSASGWLVDLDAIYQRQVALMDRLDAQFGVTAQE